jgi:hypothetical protein
MEAAPPLGVVTTPPSVALTPVAVRVVCCRASCAAIPDDMACTDGVPAEYVSP